MSQNVSLVELIGTDKLKELQKQFHQATGFANALADAEGNIVSHAGKFASICMDVIRKTELGKKRCMADDLRIAKRSQEKDGVAIYKCHAGIYDASVPIVVKSERLGFVYIGQVLTHKPLKKDVIPYAGELGVDSELYWKKYKQLPIVSFKAFRQAAGLLFFMANALAAEAAGRLDAQREISKRQAIEEALVESDNKYRFMMEAMDDPVYICSSDYRITYMNPAMIRRTGYDATGEICHEVIHGLKETCPFCMHEKVQQGGHGNLEIISPKDGCSYLVSHSPIFHKNGSISKMTLLRDITERKRIEEALLEGESRYRILIETMNDGLGAIDATGVLTYANRKLFDMVGYTEAEMIGKPLRLFFDAGNQGILRKQDAMRRKGMEDPYEITWTAKDGRRIPTLMSPAAVHDSNGKYTGCFAVVTDISNLKQTENALREREKQLEKSYSNLQELKNALEILLKKREEDKIEIQDKVLYNLKELVEPYLIKIEKTDLDDTQRGLLDIIKSNLDELISPFARKLSLKYLELTPSEIQVANFVRFGKTSKEIAKLMNSSRRTVEVHRKHIRTKIGISGKKANLRSYLLSLQ